MSSRDLIAPTPEVSGPPRALSFGKLRKMRQLGARIHAQPHPFAPLQVSSQAENPVRLPHLPQGAQHFAAGNRAIMTRPSTPCATPARRSRGREGQHRNRSVGCSAGRSASGAGIVLRSTARVAKWQIRLADTWKGRKARWLLASADGSVGRNPHVGPRDPGTVSAVGRNRWHEVRPWSSRTKGDVLLHARNVVDEPGRSGGR